MGTFDNGLLVISGKLNDGVTFEQLDLALWNELEKLNSHPIDSNELNRLMNKFRTAKEFQEQGLLNRAMNLCQFELLGDANGINEESAIYSAITPEHLLTVSQEIFKKTNCSLLKIKPQ
jgi:predicted Zn-dependent peptidase